MEGVLKAVGVDKDPAEEYRGENEYFELLSGYPGP